MAFALTWTVKFGDVASLTTITSFVLDLDIDSRAEIGECGRSRCTITLNNTGGQFTPNGSGTYANTDWLSKALVVEAATPTSNDIAFVGMITSVDVDHVNVKQSTVTIEAVDILTFAGQSPAINFTWSYSGNIDTWLDTAFFDLGTPGYQVVRLPTMQGGMASYVTALPVTSTSDQTQITNTKLPAGARVADWFNTQVFPSGPATAYVTGYGTSFGNWEWYVYVVDRDLNKTSAYAQTFTFVDGSSALTSGQLPVEKLHVGFQVDDLNNTATVDDNGGLTASTVTDAASNLKYGAKAYSATQIAASNQDVVNRAAQFWGNRYGTVRYRADNIALTFAQVEGRAVDDAAANFAFARLCAQTVLWQRADVTYRAPGMSTSTTDRTVIVGRRVMASPSDTRVELTLKSGVDNQSFELDSSTYGILDTNRLA
jgi:hypothetical protein